jgi:hypothetical protein
MDLENGPLVQAGLFRSEAEDYLFLTVHHLAVDGISWRILLEEFNLPPILRLLKKLSAFSIIGQLLRICFE